MSADIERDVAGAGPEDRAARIAGALAERGVTRLFLVGAGGWRALPPRETDLPRIILHAAPGDEIVCLDRPIRVLLGGGRPRFITSDAELADALGS